VNSADPIISVSGIIALTQEGEERILRKEINTMKLSEVIQEIA